MRILVYVKFILLLLLFSSPDISSASKDPVRAKNGMVVSASPIASEVGVEILKSGGNAVDAAVAVGFALAVTHPSAGNIGGGGFMVIYLNDGSATTIDFREKAPLAAHKNIYLDENGNYMPELSREGLTSSGIPGSVAGLIDALQKYGTMELKEVLEPAIKLAEAGFSLDYRLSDFINEYNNEFSSIPSSKKIFTQNGAKLEEGFIFKQPDLAKTLRKIASEGKDGFYKGEIAELIVSLSSSMGGLITLQDLERYNSVERKPVYGDYKGNKIISMGPPSSGGIALIQTLNIMENFNFSHDEWGSSRYLHYLSESFKRVFADRAKHLGDEDFYPVPKSWLLSKEYASSLAEGIKEKAEPSSNIYPGDPPSIESEQTTHYSVADKMGNAVSTTVTLNSSFGNKIVVEGAGFLMNNEMDDFSAKPGEPNQFGLLGSEANSILAEKRMLSAMTPTIVLKNNSPHLIAGSPGGPTIITAVVQTVLNCLEFDMDIQSAVDLPRIHHQWKPDQIDYEEYGLSLDIKENLSSRGQNIGEKRVLGRVQAIKIDADKILKGASDPRSFGSAAGY